MEKQLKKSRRSMVSPPRLLVVSFATKLGKVNASNQESRYRNNLNCLILSDNLLLCRRFCNTFDLTMICIRDNFVHPNIHLTQICMRNCIDSRYFHSTGNTEFVLIDIWILHQFHIVGKLERNLAQVFLPVVADSFRLGISS